jgi:hypothetical protein
MLAIAVNRHDIVARFIQSAHTAGRWEHHHPHAERAAKRAEPD